MEREPTPRAVNQVDEMLQEGIRLARQGERLQARDLLMRVVELDERRVAAWLWLSDVVDGSEDRVLCLENALALDPGNTAAQAGLRWLRHHEAQAEQGTVRQPGSGATDLWEDPPDPLRCPYCAAMTQEPDRRCPHCRGQLWVRARRRPAHSTWLWILISIRAAVSVGCLQASILVLAWLGHRLTGEYDPRPLLPAYLGLGQVDRALAQAAYEVIPRPVLLSLLLLAAYSLLLLVGMFVRWRATHYAMVGGAAARLLLSLALVALGHRWAVYAGGLGVLVSAFSVPVLLAVADDFAWDLRRLYFGLDRRHKGGLARLEHAQAFARQGMWALAVLYLRAAAVNLPHNGAVYVRLAHAYMRLGRRDLALGAVEDAVRVDPASPAVVRLAQELPLSRAQAQREDPESPLSPG